jgi:hypothetical protein
VTDARICPECGGTRTYRLVNQIHRCNCALSPGAPAGADTPVGSSVLSTAPVAHSHADIRQGPDQLTPLCSCGWQGERRATALLAYMVWMQHAVTAYQQEEASRPVVLITCGGCGEAIPIAEAHVLPGNPPEARCGRCMEEEAR